jgi:SAM-dependent methyltransferase
MHWLAKATVQKVIGLLPDPERWNYVLQRHVLRSLPRRDSTFLWQLTTTTKHLSTIREVDPDSDIASLAFFEFGAGWDLIGPLAFAALGVRDQTVVDLRSNVRLELIDDARSRLVPLLRKVGCEPTRDLGSVSIASVEELHERFGIKYVAPADARATGFPDETFDVITSTATLEHIPPREIAEILRESARILRPGGLFVAAIDLQDHYSYVDPGINVYNFLRYEDRTWGWINSKVHHQNRLRGSDYLVLAANSPLDLVLERSDEPRRDLAALARTPLATRFRSYERDDLATRGMRLVLRRPQT